MWILFNASTDERVQLDLRDMRHLGLALDQYIRFTKKLRNDGVPNDKLVEMISVLNDLWEKLEHVA